MKGPKVRISRRLGIAITPKASRIMERRPHPPGQHGPTMRRSKMSDYKRQLIEKQRLRFQYNVKEKQMVNYFHKAARKAINTGEALIHLLETRLDAVVLRAGLAPTIYAARQFVSHGHVEVNGKHVNIPSYNVKIGDVVSVCEKSRALQFVKDSTESRPAAPTYLEFAEGELSAKLLKLPRREEVPVICDIPLVIEYYARK
jgi:small subunit ribosomal protein S4